MEKIFIFDIHHEFSIEEAWEELENAGVDILYSDEDPDGKEKKIICRLQSWPQQNEWMAKLTTVKAFNEEADLNIDWNSQWAEHGLNFHEGHVHVSIAGHVFLLKPGPGFGDASHPTTRLVLQLMEPSIRLKTVIDIGCGSGILSLAALQLDAKNVYAIDIDENAIRHTEANACLNCLEKKLWVGSTEEFLKKKIPPPCLGLMNMISSEQEIAWDSLAPFLNGIGINELITSGVLNEEKEDYTKRWKARGWKLVSSLQENEWYAFHFVRARENL